MLLRFLIRTLSAALLVGLLSCGSPASREKADAVPETVLQSLEGNYSMKIQAPDGVHYSTAVVKELARGQYQVARITVYGPVLYAFTLGENASVESAELGKGAVTYTESIKKTTIRFEKEDFLCELSK